MKSKTLIVAVLCLAGVVQAGAQELLNYPLDTIQGEEVYRYTVEKSIGLYRIGVNFNVKQNDIIRFNPQLRERGLHYGETLYIPTGREVVVKAAEVLQETPSVADTIRENPVLPDTIQESPTVSDTIQTDSTAMDSTAVNSVAAETRQVVELALMLPFESQQTKRSGNAERMLEFYQGALLALREVQNDSTLYRLRVYDTERSERKVQALCDSTELDSVKGILGLVYPIQIERMATWCDSHEVPLLLPFSADINLSNHPQVLQFNSTEEQEVDSLCAWIASRGEEIHVVAVEVREAELSSFSRLLRKQLKANGISYSGLPLRDLLNDSAAYVLQPGKENLILLHSDRYQQVRVLLPHLATLNKVGHQIRLVSQYAWQKENITLPQIYTSVFTADANREDYDSLWSQSYVGGHVSEHPRYDLLGYDLMRALVGRLSGEKEYSGLQSVIRWQQAVEGNGWQNANVRVEN